MLENHADVLARFAELCFVHRGQILTVNDHRSLRRAFQHIDAADQRGLSGSAEADNPVDFAASDLEVNALQRFDGA